MKKLFLTSIIALITISSFSQKVVTQRLGDKQARVYIHRDATAYLYYPSLAEAKKFYKNNEPADGFIIVTKRYNFWSYVRAKRIWKQIYKK